MSTETHLQFVASHEFDGSARDIGLTDDDIRALERTLSRDPLAGALIPGGGGIRKLRIAIDGRGKRGGARVIYYYVVRRATIHLLLVYRKADAETLSAAGVEYIRRMAAEISGGTG